jgi:hypothetical protein
MATTSRRQVDVERDFREWLAVRPAVKKHGVPLSHAERARLLPDVAYALAVQCAQGRMFDVLFLNEDELPTEWLNAVADGFYLGRNSYKRNAKQLSTGATWVELIMARTQAQYVVDAALKRAKVRTLTAIDEGTRAPFTSVLEQEINAELVAVVKRARGVVQRFGALPEFIRIGAEDAWILVADVEGK